MTPNEAFLQSIREAPEDDSLRLIYADWLEEHDNADRAEFIRLQCAQPESALNWDGNFVRGGVMPETKRLADILERHVDEWLGPAATLVKKGPMDVIFRRGLASEVRIATETFRQHADTIAAGCPVLNALTLTHPRGRLDGLDDIGVLRQLTVLNVADRLEPHDARRLAESRSLERLRQLGLWLRPHRSDTDREADRDVCAILSGARHWPTWHDLHLLQLYGGVRAEAFVREVELRWDEELRAGLTARRPEVGCSLRRPWEELFPIAASPGHHFYAGRLADGRQALAEVDWDGGGFVAFFDPDGRYLARQRWAAPDAGATPVRGRPLLHEVDVIAFLRNTFAVEPGPIRVHEFTIPEEECSLYLWPGMHRDFLESQTADDEELRTILPLWMLRWLDEGGFVLEYGNDFWLDRQGEIHSS
jgi:uncharacterized protein (TIGR02996 family)